MKTSLICTVLNEEKTINRFLESVFKQTKLPDEIIINDGGSTDKTISAISNFQFPQEKKVPNIKLLFKKGNRSVGRNDAIEKASGDVILITDAGCILDKDWVKNISTPFSDKKIDVVAGYYKGLAENGFEKSLIPYVLVMEDRINGKEFLPATRSMAVKKTIWKKVGGFDEKLSHNEDYAFAIKLKNKGCKIIFAKNAIVNWIPKKNIKEAFKMFFRFALGDAQAKIFRNKVIYIFLRYIFAFYLILLSGVERSIYLYGFDALCLLSYIIWSISKNYRYVGNYKAFFYLPLLQFTSDIAVLTGTSLGIARSFSIKALVGLILNNKGVAVVILLYIASMLSVITYGVPGSSHPFDYFMDEWHQSQSVRDLFRFGTPNIAGAANGSIFQFFLTGIYLVPFYVLHLVDPFAIKSSVLNLELQTRLFEILKLNTLLFGTGSIALLGYIVKKYYKIWPFFAVFLFTINPLWLMLSNYYKYDIALVFWSLLAFLFFVKYVVKPRQLDYLMGGIFTGLALSTKLLSPLPLFVVYILMFFMFTPDFRKRTKTLLLGIAGTISVYVFFGNPDIILGRGSLVEYIYANLVQTPALNAANYVFGMDYKWFLLTKLYPVIFGHVLYALFLASLVFGLVIFIKKIYHRKHLWTLSVKLVEKNKLIVLALMTLLIYAGSLYPIKAEATNNRVLVLLPFMVIITAVFINAISRRIKSRFLKGALISVVVVVFSIQLLESYAWFPIKLSTDPRVTSSNWLTTNLPKRTLIGIESIPIYQHLPDIIVKEFYLNQYGIKTNANFRYTVVSSKSSTLPKVLVITNDEIESLYLQKSDKKELVSRLWKDGYKIVVKFQPDFKYYNVFGGELEYFISGLIQAPNTISVYEKQ
jgi:glycosyltransferase involved in cell wall biosynthesis